MCQFMIKNTIAMKFFEKFHNEIHYIQYIPKNQIKYFLRRNSMI